MDKKSTHTLIKEIRMLESLELKLKIMHYILIGVATISFIMFFGSIGSLEDDTIPILKALANAIVRIATFFASIIAISIVSEMQYEKHKEKENIKQFIAKRKSEVVEKQIERQITFQKELKHILNQGGNTMLIPQVTKSTPNGEKGFDIFSRLLDDRIIVVTGEVNDQTASVIIAQLLHLASEDEHSDIQMYINSPGGSVSAGLAILDTMNFIKPDVITICVGMAASMGAVLLSGGAKGKRYSLPNAEVMIHQPLGGTQGQASDILIAAKHIEETKKKLYNILAENTGKDVDEIELACDRDNWHSAEKAKEFGLIDDVITEQP